MTLSTDSDETLMLAYANGDIGSFETLYQRHKDGLYRYVLRQVSNQDLAHDLYQDCWSRIIKASGSYRPEAKWSTWAYRIAHNLVVDHYRAFKPLDSEAGDDELDSQTTSHAPDQLHEQQVLSTQLTHCLTRLPAVQREVFILTQETDLTLQMIAEVVAASHEAVKTRLRYARTALQDCLAKFGIRPSNTAHDTGARP